MNLLTPENLRLLLFLAPALLLSLTVHEFAHARVALAFGDPTALRAGRLTLNPMKHLSLIGTLMLFIAGFGWAKPVPVNPHLMKPARLGNIMVSLAGPMSNLALAIISGCLLKIVIIVCAKFGSDNPGNVWDILIEALLITMSINLVLCVFNLLPVFPLDGYHILGGLLPTETRSEYERFQRQYGMFILLALLFGPRLLSSMSGQYVPGPISIIFGFVHNLAMMLVQL
ncbi:MAG: site-2 protease family protein [Phycisphaerae bacterium]|nr:site-2 protease family protein [Phycisphaerae bacterium]